MHALIDDIVKRFETGTLSRRQLVQGLTLLAASGAAAGVRSQEAPFTSMGIDHISIQVTELQRSIEFYERIFGLSILDRDEANAIVRMGTTRVIVSLHEKAPTGIVDHYAIAIEGFDRETVTRTLEQHGLTPETNLDYGFHVRDPEGIPVQVMGA